MFGAFARLHSSRIERGRRIDGWEYPEAVFREAMVNALVHRDYSIAGTDILLAIYADRLEIESPGRLPNTVTVAAEIRHALCPQSNAWWLHAERLLRTS